MNYSMRQTMIQAFGEIVVKATLRRIRIVNVIIRENGLGTLFVGSYTDSFSKDQYLFSKDELALPSGAKLALVHG